MADWTTSWKPSYGYQFGPEYDTLVTSFESGAEQRRQKRSTPRHTFVLSYDAARSEATIQAIKEFHKARGGIYDEFNFPNYGEGIKGTLTCADANPDTIADSGGAFVTQGFVDTHDAILYGSGASNDGVKTVGAVAASLITLDVGQTLSGETGNASLTVYKAYPVRFASDKFTMKHVAPGLWTCTFELVEVL